MMKKVDLICRDDLDFVLGSNGDFASTEYGGFSTRLQTLRKRLSSRPGDWVLYPEIGLPLNAILGRNITKQTLQKLEQMIAYECIKDGLFTTQEVSVKAVPLNDGKIAVVLFLKDKASPDTKTLLTFSYSTTDNRLTPRMF